MEKGRRRLSYVQISRAIAIIFVLLGHVNILFYTEFKYNWFHMGEWKRTGGVDFFFIVTGFMIYYIYHKHAGVPGKGSEFLLKRFIRIYPLYWIFTLLTIAASTNFPEIDGPFTWELIYKSMLILPTDPILASTWSLSFVMFFYILFSMYMYKPKVIKPVILSWIFVLVLLELNIIPYKNNLFLFNFSNLEIIFGCLVAYLTLNYNFKYSTGLILGGMLGYLAVWTNNIYKFIDIQMPVFYCLFSMMMMLGISEKDKKNRKVPKALSFLGDASYSIYIAHGPFLQFYILILKKLSIIDLFGYFFSMSMVIVLSVISTCLVYLFIEIPITKYLRGVVFKKQSINTVESPVIYGK